MKLDDQNTLDSPLARQPASLPSGPLSRYAGGGLGRGPNDRSAAACTTRSASTPTLLRNTGRAESSTPRIVNTWSEGNREGNRTDAPTHRGFTLIELTLALAIVALVAVPLSAVLSVAFRAKASAERAVEPARTAQIIMEYLRADIQNAVPPTGTLATSFEGASSGSTADDLTFFTTADSPEHDNANGEVKQVELTIAPPATGGEAVLLRRVNRNLLATYTPVPDEEVLARNVAGLTFRYFDGTEWLTNWDSTQEQNELPCAVEVTLDLQRPAGNSDQRTFHFVRVFPISTSTVSSFVPAAGLGGL